MISGPLRGYRGASSDVAVLAYKEMLEAANQCHVWNAPRIARGDIPTDLRFPSEM